MPKERILVVDDEPDIRDVLRLTLEAEGYEVHEAADGEEGVRQVRKVNPHLVLLDYKMPKMVGSEVCKTLRKDILLQSLPIILLTSKGESSDKVEGLNAGADDYVTKPFDPPELLARVRMILRRTARSLDANPLTKLPGNVSIIEEIQTRVDTGNPVAVCYADLDNFKAFNDKYGFERGDEALKMTARILLIAIREVGTPADFLGHIGGDDFILITTPPRVEPLCQKIIAELARTASSLYDEEDLRHGYIESKDRDGKARNFPLLTISIGVVTNEQRPIKHVAEVAELGAELKHWAKTHGGNRWVKDRRGE
ncbi:MAG: response regulator [Candidatus Omnitrophota bacterium]|nr:response regulator [Candidatus Omnitrophota bacterium]